MRVAEAIKQAAMQLAAQPAVAASAGRDAELLMMHLLSVERVDILSRPERELTAEQVARYEAMVRQRLASTPIQYIVGVQEFYSLRLRVTPAVLIPRPETEHLVEALLERLPRERDLKIADVGTGSGAIAIALAYSLPMARVTALDISAAALAVARENAERHSVTERMEFLRSDLLEAVSGREFDAIVSNPPYIALGERGGLHPQVREFEPAMALFAGESGLEIYERLVPQAFCLLRSGGWLMLEIGAGQRDGVAALLKEWSEVSFVPDLQQIPRVAIARKAH